jgi:hypothetical protein
MKLQGFFDWLTCQFLGHKWMFGWARKYDDTGHEWYDQRDCRRCQRRETRDTYGSY